jgi:hypothetical protein
VVVVVVVVVVVAAAANGRKVAVIVVVAVLTSRKPIDQTHSLAHIHTHTPQNNVYTVGSSLNATPDALASFPQALL